MACDYDCDCDCDRVRVCVSVSVRTSMCSVYAQRAYDSFVTVNFNRTIHIFYFCHFPTLHWNSLVANCCRFVLRLLKRRKKHAHKDNKNTIQILCSELHLVLLPIAKTLRWIYILWWYSRCRFNDVIYFFSVEYLVNNKKVTSTTATIWTERETEKTQYASNGNKHNEIKKWVKYTIHIHTIIWYPYSRMAPEWAHNRIFSSIQIVLHFLESKKKWRENAEQQI